MSDDARRLGAVNTAVFHKGRAIGHNTDWFGFAEAFRRTMDGVAVEAVVQLGAGAAVAHVLLSLCVGQVLVADTGEMCS